MNKVGFYLLFEGSVSKNIKVAQNVDKVFDIIDWQSGGLTSKKWCKMVANKEQDSSCSLYSSTYEH